MGSNPNSRRASRIPRLIAGLTLTGLFAAQSLALAAQESTGQQGDPPQRLEELIPDSAVENPDDWAADRAQTAQGGDGGQVQSDLQPDSPLTDTPAITLDWPDDLQIAEPERIERDRDAQEALADAPEIEGPEELPLKEFEVGKRLVIGFPEDGDIFPERDEFLARFRSFSTIRELGGGEGNVAQLAARARSDEDLLNRLLRIYGYYNAQVIRSIAGLRPGRDGSEPAPRVRFDILPGDRYAFGAIDLGGLDTAPDHDALRGAVGIESGDPLSSDRIVQGRFGLDEALGESGYPFAAIKDPELLVDHARAEGDLTMPVEPGGKYAFGEVTSNVPKYLSDRHLERIARFDMGDTYQRSLELDLRRAIVATGLVSSVTVTPRETAPPEGDKPGVVALDVTMEKAKTRSIAGAIGYGTEDGFKVEASWEDRNFFPPEGMLRIRGIAGTREQLTGITYRRNNFRGRDQLLTVDAYASNVKTEAVDARTVAVRGAFERLSNLLFQKPFSWSVGAEVLFTDERNRVIGGIPRPRQEYLIGSLFGRATIDTSDSLLDPTKGFRVTAFLAPEVSRSQGSETFYLRNQLDASIYKQLNEGMVIAGRTRLASIQGAEIFQIAPSRRIYAGGAGSVRGYAYQAVGPRTDFGEPTGGRSLVEFSLEARIDTGLMDGAVSLVPFIDMGTVSLKTTPDFRFVNWGAGLGLRYNTSFGPIRVDVGVPLNRNPLFDSRVVVYVGLGQTF
ncbi:autotransporter assembly complex protein TamA [Altererythrobacter sp.]|uniref:autotransporter assembly complex protein TamA n=1 Tax=Altererythrobacter sp. TaxID=1872480 RepID=UPI003D013A8A